MVTNHAAPPDADTPIPRAPGDAAPTLPEADARPSAQFVPTVFVGAIIQILVLFVVLVGLAVMFPTSVGNPADPLNQAMFQPRPEWYFLSLFQMLKAFAGSWEVVGTVIIPVVAIVALVALPFYDRRSERSPRRRPIAMALFWIVTVLLLYGSWQSEGAILPFAQTGAAVTTSPPASTPSSGATGSASIAYTTDDIVPLAATPGGSPVAKLTVDTPLTVVAQKGQYTQVTMNVWMRQTSTTVFYVDTGALGSAIQAGTLAMAVPKPLEIKTDPNTGVAWKKVALGGWVATQQMASSQTTLWATGEQLYSNSCGVCHALHNPSEFTSLQWVGNIKPMGPRTALTKAQLDLVLNYLQWHASDTAGQKK